MSFDVYIVGFITVVSLNLMVPVSLTAIGEIFSEKSGVVNIGLEGIMLTGAAVSVFVDNFAKSGYVALLAGALAGVALGLLHAYVAIWLKGDQIITGVGINIFALGFAPFSIIAIYGVAGSFPAEYRLPEIPAPGGGLSYFVPGTIFAAILFWYILNRTRQGSVVRAVGENPEAADAVGINVELVRLFAVLIGASLAGLAGAYLSIDNVGYITKDISAGRGFIALATVVFAGWNPILGLLGGTLFGFSQEISG